MESIGRHIDYDKVEEMVEGDEEFRTQLFQAIQVAIRELQDTYAKGIMLKDMDMIRQARHKIKPTLFLFGLETLNRTLSDGKRLMSAGGMDQDFSDHLRSFMGVINELQEELEKFV
ncbi:hypothetical protein ADIS_0147 [Lunatimonas lonarensis]|uniref:HPt domain-containing protein n=1 Tax=Lunatimonas lonarensis TaxID=1232681 RepID=R7ZZ32_9BACT|nr:hypothetical protein [Lunatimonas lonarensis]EON79345.1 hypothetical protein ADIS_0147 [Lunatimonas lonarensis]